MPLFSSTWSWLTWHKCWCFVGWPLQLDRSFPLSKHVLFMIAFNHFNVDCQFGCVLHAMTNKCDIVLKTIQIHHNFLISFLNKVIFLYSHFELAVLIYSNIILSLVYLPQVRNFFFNCLWSWQVTSQGELIILNLI